MIGTRGIWHKGWKAVTVHGPLPSNIGNFDQDQWQLFHTDEDRAEAIDLAQENPEKLKQMIALWHEEAEKYNVFPLTDVSVPEIHALEYHVAAPKTGRYIYYPGATEIPEASAATRSAVRGWPSATTAATRSAPTTLHASSSPAAASSRSSTTWRTTCSSTRSARWPPWRGTDAGARGRAPTTPT